MLKGLAVYLHYASTRNCRNASDARSPNAAGFAGSIHANRLERSRFRLCLRAEAFTVDGNLCQSRGFFKLFYSLDGLQYDCRRQNQTF